MFLGVKVSTSYCAFIIPKPINKTVVSVNKASTSISKTIRLFDLVTATSHDYENWDVQIWNNLTGENKPYFGLSLIVSTTESEIGVNHPIRFGGSHVPDVDVILI